MFTACQQREIGVLERGDAWIDLVAGLTDDPYPWLLDSALEAPPLGRFGFAGSDPYMVLRAYGRRIELERRRDVRPDLPAGPTVWDGDPLDALRALLPPPPVEGFDATPPFIGGAVGYLGYELAQHTLPIRAKAAEDPGIADLAFLFVDQILAFDLSTRRLVAIGLGFGARPSDARRGAERRVEALRARCARLPPRPTRAAVAPARAPLETSQHFDASSYPRRVEIVKEEIARGNVYQANLTHRIDVRFEGDAWQLYRSLRRANPAPFACFFALPELAIAGSSPERFLRIDRERRVESRPIKGTRPRGRTPDEDAALAAELFASEKERAENVMIVDLVRNDLGRVCETGSIAVPELLCVETYASVFQLVSTVTGRLAADRDVVDALRATFPPGSMTGAPKIAAVRLLERLEPVRRGIYSGAIGYLDARGGADLCVAIRSIFLRKGRAGVHVGGGIVFDSDPHAEYRETLDKARALLEALAVPDPRAASLGPEA
ncbi:MAG: aminodeoxychorismate synthase component I [Deltaproteobacteria bacterium]|nr:MAG: aminodeoxychorismate synthase component I [Deltaproteobacteria bacterium]